MRHVEKFQRFESRLVETSPDTRTVRYVLSTGASDRMNDTIAPGGWRLDNYRKNPVLLLNHDKRSLPIGRAVSIGVQGDQLVGAYQFASADDYPLADTVYRLVKGGFMPGGSVGFMPIKYSFNEETNGIDFIEQELLEFSAVTVPCNPEALTLSFGEAKDLGISLKAFDELRAAIAAQKGAPAPQPGRHVARATANANQVRVALI